jgi:tRNA A-37 threonylcarbamoyl transferase component Bud32
MVHKTLSLREERHVNKVFYLGSNELFYEPNYAHYRPSDDLINLVDSMIEARGGIWKTRRVDVWTHVVPAGPNAAQLPLQGWKIHVSAHGGNCHAILAKVAALAFEHGVQFKFANDVNTLRMMTSKRWPRGGSGKFITLYPMTDEAFKEFIELAYAVLKDDVGSYILSDRRYKDCRCLYYRYGGFILVNRLHYLGKKIPMLRTPDGDYVPDQRNPYFEMPPWVSDPFPSDEPDEGDFSLDRGRYMVKSALGFSNTGGVYLATDTTTGNDVVIKEARPYTELAMDGKDATSRLALEERNLRILDGLGIAPQVHGTFWDWENFYLVEEHIDALDMRITMLMQTPLLRARPTLADSQSYYRNYVTMFTSLLDAVDQIHQKGLVIGDLSPPNILVEKATMTVRVIDLEGAYRPGFDQAQELHTPGFRLELKGRKKESNLQDDMYALGAIMLYAMFPLSVMAHLRTDLFTRILPVLVRDLGWVGTPVQHVIEQLVGHALTCREASALLRGSATIAQPMQAPSPAPLAPADTAADLARFITHHYRLDPLYTLFPIDPYGASTNPAGFGFGSTGIVYALSACGVAVPPEALERHHREIAAIDPHHLVPGFLVGAAGMAWAALLNGDLETGKRFLGYANASPLQHAHHSMFYGMAGIGMANLAAYLILDDKDYLTAAVALAETLAATAVTDARGLHWHDDGGVRLGFGYGQSGVALFFLRLSQVLGVTTWHELGLQALAYDLSFAQEIEPGVVQFGASPSEQNTFESYIEEGTAGILKVAIRYGLWDRLAPLFADLHRKYSSFAGLIFGVSGFADALLDGYLYSQDEKYLDMARRPLDALADLYVFPTENGAATPGDNLFRVTCDFATGVAGVMRTLHRFAHLAPDAFFLDVLDGLPAPTAPKADRMRGFQRQEAAYGN